MPKKKPALRKLSRYPTERGIWSRIQGALNHNDRRAYRIEAVATPGFPDVVWITEKRVFFIELKAGPMRFRELQRKFIKDAFRLGVTVWVVHQHHRNEDITVYPGIVAVDGGALEGGRLITHWLDDMTNGVQPNDQRT